MQECCRLHQLSDSFLLVCDQLCMYVHITYVKHAELNFSVLSRHQMRYSVQVDFAALLAEVDSMCRTWKKPTLLLFGQKDPFINSKTTFAFLQNQRTNFELAQLAIKVHTLALQHASMHRGYGHILAHRRCCVLVTAYFLAQAFCVLKAV